MQTTLLIIIALLLLIVIILIIVFRHKGGMESPLLQQKVGEMQSGLARCETNLKDEFKASRDEHSNSARINREELNKAIGDFRTEIMTAVKAMTEQNNAALEKL